MLRLKRPIKVHIDSSGGETAKLYGRGESVVYWIEVNERLGRYLNRNNKAIEDTRRYALSQDYSCFYFTKKELTEFKNSTKAKHLYKW